MWCITSRPFFLLPTLLFISSTFVLLSHGASRFEDLPTEQVHGFNTWEIQRSVLEEANAHEAADTTRRIGLLDHYNNYEGGWNITNKHYLLSLGYRALPLFSIAAIWFILCGLYLTIICCCCYCRRKQTNHGYSPATYYSTLTLLIVFTVAAIFGSTILFMVKGAFQNNMTHMSEYVNSRVKYTTGTLTNVLNDLGDIKTIAVNNISLPPEVQTSIDEVRTTTDVSAQEPKIQNGSSYSKALRNILSSMKMSLNINTIVMIVLAILGLLCSTFGMQFFVYIFIIIGWFMVASMFVLCGFYLILHNGMADTCVAMDEWIQNPTPHTALGEIFPCVDNATTLLSVSNNVTFEMVSTVNKFIINVANINGTPGAGPLSFNQSGPLVPVLCNPLYPDKTNRKCVAGEVDSSNADEVWEKYVCDVSANGNCTTTGRLKPHDFSQITRAANASYTLHEESSNLTKLADCTIVRETFTKISKEYCSRLKLQSYWIYIGIATVSGAVMLSAFLWPITTREWRHRVDNMNKFMSSYQNPMPMRAL